MDESVDVCSIIMGNKEKMFVRFLCIEEMFIQNKKRLENKSFHCTMQTNWRCRINPYLHSPCKL